MLLATMRPSAPPELALWAFFEEHRRCGELDGGVEGEVLSMTCECGAVHVQQTRQLLRKLLVGRLRCTPDPTTGTVRVQGEGTLGPLMGLLELPRLPTLVAPRGMARPAPRPIRGAVVA